MFWEMLKGALVRQSRKMFMVAITIALGVSLTTAMLNVMLDVGDKVNRELKAYGANITVIPRAASVLRDVYGIEASSGKTGQYLQEADVGKLKTIFWANNIVAFSPLLETKATVGDIKGAMVGSTLARKLNLHIGDSVEIALPGGTQREALTVQGIFNSGGAEDDQIFVTLPFVQQGLNLPGKIGKIEVSAITTPENELARKAAHDPKSLSLKEWETWYCTAYVSSIAYQIEEAVGDSRAKPVRQVAESEGTILQKTQLLMLLITGLSLAGSALGISNLLMANIMERSREFGLLKALGATDRDVLLLTLTEIMTTGLVGGIAGYFLGLGFAQIIGHNVFGTAVAINGMVIPWVIISVILITLVGSLPAMRMLLSLRPAAVLHGR
ncbi:MAG: MacB-like periplasmic core domain containing protein [Firmicutes bacterium]|nr:MacB-like periplasmic core domain containing protein [Bacillota bacterium]